MADLTQAPLSQATDEALEETLTFVPEKKSKRGKIIRRVILWSIVLAVVAALAYVVYALFFKPAPPTQFMTDIARYGTIENKVTGAGTITAQTRQDVPMSATGEVTGVFVAIGDMVEIGQPLFEVNEDAIIEDLNEKQQALTQAQKNVTQVYEQIDGQTLRAPFSGKTLSVGVEKGDIVAKGDVLAVMADDSKMRLVAFYSTAFQSDIKVGQRAVISIPKSMALLDGVVDRVEHITKITDEGTTLFEVELLMDNPGTLTKGMMATAMIQTEAGEVAPAESATLTYNREENIKAKTAGEILTVSMRDYYSFTPGETLLTMINDNLDSQLSSELKLLDSAKKSYEDIAKQYKYYKPLAEIAGQVVAVNIAEGDELTGQTGVAVSVADNSRMIMDITVDEMYVAKLKVGMPAMVSSGYGGGNYDSKPMPVGGAVAEGGGGGMYPGTLTSIAMQGTVGTGMSSFPAKIEVQGAAGLMSGMWLDYTIVIDRVENVLVVPSNAVKYVEGGTICFVRKEALRPDHKPADTLDDATKEQTPDGFAAVWVVTGASDSMLIEIKEGLADQDEVATTAIRENPYGRY